MTWGRQYHERAKTNLLVRLTNRHSTPADSILALEWLQYFLQEEVSEQPSDPRMRLLARDAFVEAIVQVTGQLRVDSWMIRGESIPGLLTIRSAETGRWLRIKVYT